MKHMKQALYLIAVIGILALTACKKSNSVSGTFTVDGTTYNVTSIAAGALQVDASTYKYSATWMEISFPGIIPARNVQNALPENKTYRISTDNARVNDLPDSLASIRVQIEPAGGSNVYYSSVDTTGRLNVSISNGVVSITGTGVPMTGPNGRTTADFNFKGGYSWP